MNEDMSTYFYRAVNMNSMSREYGDAVCHGDLASMQRMLREGRASNKERDGFNWSALMLALLYSQYPVA
jgi:hypothetical protein